MINRFGIHLKVKDINKSYDFYKALGFKAIFTYGSKESVEKVVKDFPGVGSAPEKYNGITFDINGSLFEIADGHLAVKPEVFKQGISSSKVSAMIDGDVDEIVRVAMENNFEIAVQPREFPWGTREVVLRDPDGFILVFREFIKNYLENPTSK